jgi:hypothetical protein
MEYENPEVPEDLARRFDGYEVAVGIAFDGSGQFGCGYQTMVHKPRHAVLRLSRQTLGRIATPLCYSIQKWKFRPFIYDGKAAPVMGPVVVTIRDGKFVLGVLDPPVPNESTTSREAIVQADFAQFPNRVGGMSVMIP